MVLWPAVTLLGFVLLTAFVIAMGATSTARYEREKERADLAGADRASAEPIGAVQAA
jgi:hypothetical protein